jgi:hypothetical protein
VKDEDKGCIQKDTSEPETESEPEPESETVEK